MDICPAYVSKHSVICENEVINLMTPKGKDSIILR